MQRSGALLPFRAALAGGWWEHSVLELCGLCLSLFGLSALQDWPVGPCDQEQCFAVHRSLVKSPGNLTEGTSSLLTVRQDRGWLAGTPLSPGAWACSPFRAHGQEGGRSLGPGGFQGHIVMHMKARGFLDPKFMCSPRAWSQMVRDGGSGEAEPVRPPSVCGSVSGSGCCGLRHMV